jgi:hypothetical protein
MRDPGRAGDATCKMRDGSRLRNPRSCRHHVRASLKDFAQSKASLFAYSLASPVSPSPLSQLCVDRFDLAFFSCTISDPRSSPPSVPPLSSPTEDCHCARLSCLPARQRWTPFNYCTRSRTFAGSGANRLLVTALWSVARDRRQQKVHWEKSIDPASAHQPCLELVNTMHRSAEMNAVHSPPCFHSMRGALAAPTNFVLSDSLDEDQQAGS